ncbi:MAG: hypothetical protein ABFR36_01890 [Acidobacteriota bacterium]
MNFRVKFIIIIVSVFFLQSCIDLGLYVSEIPLSESDRTCIDPRITGVWEMIKKDDEEKTKLIEFIEFNEHEYVLRIKDDSIAGIARVFITKTGKNRFLNVQDLSDKKRDYIFCRYRISKSDELKLEFIEDTLFKDKKFTSEKKLRKFIIRNSKNSLLFHKELSFTFRKINVGKNG